MRRQQWVVTNQPSLQTKPSGTAPSSWDRSYSYPQQFYPSQSHNSNFEHFPANQPYLPPHQAFSSQEYTIGQSEQYLSAKEQFPPQGEHFLSDTNGYYLNSIYSKGAAASVYHPYPEIYHPQNQIGMPSMPQTHLSAHQYQVHQRESSQSSQRSPSGTSRTKRSRRSHWRRQSNRNAEFESGSMSMALLAPGLVPGLPLVAPHVAERPPGGYYWALINNHNLVIPEDITGIQPSVSPVRSRRRPLRSSRRRNRNYLLENENGDSGKENDDILGNGSIKSGDDNDMSSSNQNEGIDEDDDDDDNDDDEIDDVGVDDAITMIDEDEDEYEDEGDDDDDDDDDDSRYVPRSRGRSGRPNFGGRPRKNGASSNGNFSRQAIKAELNQLQTPLVPDQQHVVPIQMCQPPLCNILPAYPQALDADPQPRTRKQSKYSAEQDQLILDLKSQGKGWVEIAKLANCQNPLAARNRYQVLIGQQGGGTFIWTNEDCAALQDSLDEGERAKWLFIAQELSRKLSYPFTVDMVHYKIASIFAEKPETFGILRSKDPTRGGAPFDRVLLYTD